MGAGPDTTSYPPSAAGRLSYQLSFTVSAAAFKEYAKRLDTLRNGNSGTITTLQYSGALNASQSVVDAAHQTILSQLVSDARARAQALALASGLRVGAVQSISESGYANGSVNTQYTFYISVSFSVAGQ